MLRISDQSKLRSKKGKKKLKDRRVKKRRYVNLREREIYGTEREKEKLTDGEIRGSKN